MRKIAVPAEKRITKARRTVSERPAEPERAGLRAQGIRTRNAIVRVAKKLLLESGSLEFSLREVADRAEISISNLQYYFPTRLALLRAVVEPVVDTYLDRLKHALESDGPSRETIRALAERAYSDAKNTEHSAVWWHFASLAAIDPECSQLLDGWYESVTREIAQLIRVVNPDCKLADSLHRAVLIIAMADGLAYQIGAGRRMRDYTRGLDVKFLATVELLVYKQSQLGGKD